LFVAVGASVFTVAYLASAIGATTGYDAVDDDKSDRGVLWIPIVGPFIAVGQVHAAGPGVVYALDGVVQAGSVALFGLGLAGSHVGHVRQIGGSPAIEDLAVVPMVGGGATGAIVAGTF
jgi:hypothetical protein